MRIERIQALDGTLIERRFAETAAERRQLQQEAAERGGEFHSLGDAIESAEPDLFAEEGDAEG